MRFSRMPVTGVVGASRSPAPRTADLLPLRAPPPAWGPPPLFLCVPSPATRSRWHGGSGHRQPCHAWSQTGQKDRKSPFPTLRRCPILPCLPRAHTRCAPARGDAPAGTRTSARGGRRPRPSGRSAAPPAPPRGPRKWLGAQAPRASPVAPRRWDGDPAACCGSSASQVPSHFSVQDRKKLHPSRESARHSREAPSLCRVCRVCHRLWTSF